MNVTRLGPAALGAALALWALPAAAALADHGQAVTVRAAPYRSRARFTVSYSGSGSWSTSYHAEPSDGGGKHDTDIAHDSSTQAWSMKFSEQLVVPRCGCGRIAELSGARGRTSATGRIDHLHIDGLYTQLNASLKCRVQTMTPRRMALDAAIELGYVRRSRSLAVTALNPVDDALVLLPSECPDQGDALDGLADNYFTPGFSFASAWGPSRWFSSATIHIPLSTLHRAARIAIRLGDTDPNTPPRDCSVPYPSWQRCRAGGSWTGTLTLTAG